jgi:hypothetical protein
MGKVRAALALLGCRERVLLVIGSEVIAGCFFSPDKAWDIAANSCFWRRRDCWRCRVLPRVTFGIWGLGASIVILLLMWGECIRLAIERGLEQTGKPALFVGIVKVLFRLVRELGWCWTISLMLVVVADYLDTSPAMQRVSSLCGRLALRTAR